MKKLFSLKTLFFILIVFIASCAKDDDEPTQSGTFKGNWYINETSSDFGPSTYNVAITDTASNIQISYLYGFPQSTFALVSGNSFTIPVQIIQGSNVSGGGVLTTTTRIDMTYYVQSTATHYDTVVAVLTKL